MDIPLFVIVIIAVALIFDFLNGFHDAANSIATIVVTRALTPFQAVLLAAFANFIGAFIFGVAIANTIGKGVLDNTFVTLSLIFAALMGAIIWNIITWYFGLPTSSSHALIGGLVGAGIASVGMKAILAKGLLKILVFIIIAPLLGMIAAMIFTVIIIWVFHKIKRAKANKSFRWMQLISASAYSISHGTNDAQKTMGIIALTLLTAGVTAKFQVSMWIILSCHAAIALGTFFGGWRIVKTMGTSITKIRPMEGFCAETSSAVVLMGTAHAGIPVSTTHVISGSIMGVGTIENARNVRWTTARKIMWAWVLTIPISAVIAAGCYFVVKMFV